MKAVLLTEYSAEKAGAITALLQGLDDDKAIAKLEQIIEVANSHLDSDFASEDTRYHWIEILLIAEEFKQQYED